MPSVRWRLVYRAENGGGDLFWLKLPFVGRRLRRRDLISKTRLGNRKSSVNIFGIIHKIAPNTSPGGPLLGVGKKEIEKESERGRERERERERETER